MVNVMTVTGTPTFMYSRKLIWLSLQAFSMTMILATEPVMVRLPVWT